jgi:hypothetical protein
MVPDRRRRKGAQCGSNIPFSWSLARQWPLPIGTVRNVRNNGCCRRNGLIFPFHGPQSPPQERCAMLVHIPFSWSRAAAARTAHIAMLARSRPLPREWHTMLVHNSFSWSLAAAGRSRRNSAQYRSIFHGLYLLLAAGCRRRSGVQYRSIIPVHGPGPPPQERRAMWVQYSLFMVPGPPMAAAHRNCAQC